MNELKRCPFCGGEAFMYHSKAHESIILGEKVAFKGATFIECGACNCIISEPTEEKAIQAWNTRKPMERIIERLEEKAEKAMANSEKAAELGRAYEKHMIFNGAKGNAFEEAIDIVMEEGRIE